VVQKSDKSETLRDLPTRKNAIVSKQSKRRSLSSAPRRRFCPLGYDDKVSSLGLRQYFLPLIEVVLV